MKNAEPTPEFRQNVFKSSTGIWAAGRIADHSRISLLLGWPTVLDERATTSIGKRPRLSGTGSRYDLRRAVEYQGDGHLVTFAPTGAGKGVGVIIPNLLHYRGPIIVIDPKGENFAVTAGFRQRLGHEVILLDPFRAVDDEILARHGVPRAQLSPLDLCLLATTSIENDAQTIAEAISMGGTVGEQAFWDISALKLLSAVIAMEMENARLAGRAPSFRNIVSVLYSEAIEFELRSRVQAGMNSEFVQRSIGGGYLGIEAPLTRAGILATVQSYLSLLTSEDLLSSVDRSTFRLKDIQTSQHYTLYIVIPPNKLDSHSVVLKLWIATLLYSIMEREQRPRLPTLFMLDECANLGKLDLLKKAVTLLRGYGLQVWMFFQDLAQIERLYETEYRTMINNCGVMQIFGIARMLAAAPLASIIGKYEPEDIRALDKGHQILSIADGDPIVARLMRYYADAAFRGRFERNPLLRAQDQRTGGAARLLLRPRIYPGVQ